MKKEEKKVWQGNQLSTVLVSTLFEQKESIKDRFGSLSRELGPYKPSVKNYSPNRDTSRYTVSSIRWSALWFGSALGLFVSSLLFWFLLVQTTLLVQIGDQYAGESGYISKLVEVYNKNDMQLVRVQQLIESDKTNLLLAGCTSASLDLNITAAPAVVFGRFESQPTYQMYHIQNNKIHQSYEDFTRQIKSFDSAIHKTTGVTEAKNQLADVQKIRSICGVLEKPDVTLATASTICTQLKTTQFTSSKTQALITERYPSVCQGVAVSTILSLQSATDTLLTDLISNIRVNSASDNQKNQVNSLANNATAAINTIINDKLTLDGAWYVPDTSF